MENFNINITNFGKLAKADIRIGDFTVFAGPNNTGKSFVSKALYSIFGATNVNHVEALFDWHLFHLRYSLKSLEKDGDIQNTFLGEAVREIANAVGRLRRLVGSISVGRDGDELSAVEDIFPRMSDLLHEIKSTFAEIKPELERAINSRSFAASRRMSFSMKSLESMVSRINFLAVMCDEKYTPMEFIVKGLENQISKNLRANLQAENVSDLCRHPDKPACFDIENVGTFDIADREGKAVISPEGLRFMRNHSGVLYLESPTLWRLKDALEPVKNYDQQFVPEYFHDMLWAIRRGRDSKHPKFSDACDELADEIGGHVVFDSATEDLMFHEDGDERRYPLHMAAMGVANFGMLGLLIKRNLLDDSTFLFVDEPEAHLHPAWQVAMTRMLIHLAEQGVKVVMTTHSADILKWIEIYVKENPEAEGLFALNHFTDGTVKSGDGFREDLGGILDDLTKPYQHMFIRGLRA